jgi:hypothetical protein
MAAAQEYRTVVIVGDTQSHVSGGASDDYAYFTAMVGWIVANKYAENIDFVMQVGDITNLGLWMPLPAGQCDGAPPRETWQCRSGGSCLSPLPAGCWQVTPTYCVSCDASADVMGPGYNQYFSAQKFQSLEQQFAGSDRHFELLETYQNEDQDGYVWKFRLGTEEDVVVGPSVWPTATQRQWVQNVVSQHSDTPMILLSHDMIERNALWQDVVNQMPMLAPQLFMTVQGHIGQDQKSIVDIQGYRVLRTVNDWSYQPVKSYLTLVRFYFDPNGVEALTYSPALDQFNLLSTNYVELQAFGIDQDPDHDNIVNPLDSCPTTFGVGNGCRATGGCGLGAELALLLPLLGLWRSSRRKAALEA